MSVRENQYFEFRYAGRFCRILREACFEFIWRAVLARYRWVSSLAGCRRGQFAQHLMLYINCRFQPSDLQVAPSRILLLSANTSSSIRKESVSIRRGACRVCRDASPCEFGLFGGSHASSPGVSSSWWSSRCHGHDWTRDDGAHRQPDGARWHRNTGA